MTDISDADGDTPPVSVRVLVPDGGELEAPEEAEDEEVDEADDDASADEEDGEEPADEEDASEGEEDEEDEADAAEEEDEAEGEEEAEEGEDEEREAAEADEGTRLLHLNLDRVFLDLLGLEVDLDEVTLDLTARTGEGKLLGNLLSAVSGLLGGDGLGSLLGGEDGLLPDLPSMPDLNPMERARALAGALAQRIRDVIGDIVSALPFEDLLAQFLQELVGQLLDSGNGEDDDAASA